MFWMRPAMSFSCQRLITKRTTPLRIKRVRATSVAAILLVLTVRSRVRVDATFERVVDLEQMRTGAGHRLADACGIYDTAGRA
jgi:hypothetical protein